MTGLAVVGIASMLVSVAGFALGIYLQQVRLAGYYRNEFADTVADLTNDPTVPASVMDFLFGVAPLLSNREMAVSVLIQFSKALATLPMDGDGRLNLPLDIRERLGFVMRLFLMAVSYRSVLLGPTMRTALLGRRGDAAVAVEVKELAHRIGHPGFQGLAVV